MFVKRNDQWKQMEEKEKVVKLFVHATFHGLAQPVNFSNYCSSFTQRESYVQTSWCHIIDSIPLPSLQLCLSSPCIQLPEQTTRTYAVLLMNIDLSCSKIVNMKFGAYF